MDVPIKEEAPSAAEANSRDIVTTPPGKYLPFAWDSCSKDPLRSRISIKQQAVEDAFHHAKFICHSIVSALKDEKPEAFKELFDQEIVGWVDEICKSNPFVWKLRRLTCSNRSTRRSAHEI